MAPYRDKLKPKARLVAGKRGPLRSKGGKELSTRLSRQSWALKRIQKKRPIGKWTCQGETEKKKSGSGRASTVRPVAFSNGALRLSKAKRRLEWWAMLEKSRSIGEQSKIEVWQ